MKEQTDAQVNSEFKESETTISINILKSIQTKGVREQKWFPYSTKLRVKRERKRRKMVNENGYSSHE